MEKRVVIFGTSVEYQKSVLRVLKDGVHTIVFTSLVPRLCMIAVPYSLRAAVSPRRALTATLVVTRMFDKSTPLWLHSEM